MTKTRTRIWTAKRENAVNLLLAAVHYSEQFDGGALAAEQASPSALADAKRAGFVVSVGHELVGLTDDGSDLIRRVLADADVDAADHEAVAEWAQSVSPRVKDFESRVDTWSALELHALESMINELRR